MSKAGILTALGMAFSIGGAIVGQKQQKLDVENEVSKQMEELKANLDKDYAQFLMEEKEQEA